KLAGGAECDVDMVLLKLNLVGIRAMITRDLRMLDALNNFYELPRRLWTSRRANPRLLVFWLCIYAQLLRTPDLQQCWLQESQGPLARESASPRKLNTSPESMCSWSCATSG